MSLPIALGAKSVSSRPLVGIRDDDDDDDDFDDDDRRSRRIIHGDDHQEHEEEEEEEEYQYYAEDGITGLIQVQIPGSVPLTATTVCPYQEWLAIVTIEYFDMLMVIDDNNDYDHDDDSNNNNDNNNNNNNYDDDDDEKEVTNRRAGNHPHHHKRQKQRQQQQQQRQRRRRIFARHSTVAEVRIQISPLSIPFSSYYRNIKHRLTLPAAATTTTTTSTTTRRTAARTTTTRRTTTNSNNNNNQRGGRRRGLLLSSSSSFDDEVFNFEEYHQKKKQQQEQIGGDDEVVPVLSIQPALVFSSDRKRLACLIPYHPRRRGSSNYFSALVAFDLKRPSSSSSTSTRRPPPPLPKLPSYIPTPSYSSSTFSSSSSSSSTTIQQQQQQQQATTSSSRTRKTTASGRMVVPEARDNPQWLSVPSGGTALDLQHNVDYWIHNITSICNASCFAEGDEAVANKASSSSSCVLLAGCKDGSILGISFQPLLLAGRLYHPVPNPQQQQQQQIVTCISHITTTAAAAATTTTPACNPGDTVNNNESVVEGRLVTLQANGKATIFQTRMILSSLLTTTTTTTSTTTTDTGGEDYYNLQDSTSNLNIVNMIEDDETEFSTTETTTISPHHHQGMIHGESFNVVKKTGRRHSLPANSRLVVDNNEKEGGGGETQPLLLGGQQQFPSQQHHHHHHQQQSPSKNRNTQPAVQGDTGLLMFVEPSSEYSGRYSRAQWLSGGLLALLDRPLPANNNNSNNDTRNRVAQVIGILPKNNNSVGRQQQQQQQPEVLTELTLTSDDLLENADIVFSLKDGDDELCYDDTDDEDCDNLLFPMLDASTTGGGGGATTTTRTNALLSGNNISDAMDATLGIHHDPYSGCLAISSARILNTSTTASTTKRGDTTTTPQVRVFVCLWNWRNNVLGFTAVGSCSSYPPQRPISRLLFTKQRRTNVRHLAHLRCAGDNGELDRIRKDVYNVGVLSPSQDVRKRSGSAELHLASPLLLTSTSVNFALASQPSNKTCEVEWQECTIPVSYRLEYGSPCISAISSSGQSIAVASSRGLCVLECTPRAKKFTVGKERGHLFEETQQSGSEQQEGQLNRRGYLLPPKWHVFGSETEERAFRVLTMAWWRGNADAKRSHASDDLLVSVIQIQRQNDKSADPPGTCYLACWSQRRLDAAHQRLRPLDDNLRSSRSQWGVRLPKSFLAKSLSLCEQPIPTFGVTKTGRQQERKAVILLTAEAGPTGAVDFLVFQCQAIQSVGRTQSTESYQEHNPFSVLSRQCSGGQVDCKPGGSSIASLFLASASFQFDLRQRRNRVSVSNGPASEEEGVSEIVGTLGVVRSPGCGLDAVAITSSGPSKSASILSGQANGATLLQARTGMKSSEVSSYWLSDLIPGQRTFKTTFGEHAIADFFVWTFQLADGKLFSWFVPCLEFSQVSSDPKVRGFTPNAFCSRIMLGLVCPVGTSTTWLRPSPAKTGRDFMIGCMPNSAHGCVLSTGQTSRKFHRTIAGDFDHSLFANDFLQHEFLYPKDFELSPPSFISSLAALLRSEAFLLSSCDASGDKLLRAQNPNRFPVNAGGDDVTSAILAVDASSHTQLRSQSYQDAAFMALRLLVLRTTEQLTDDLRKQKETAQNDQPILSQVVMSQLLSVVQSCSSSRLQFASLVLEVGRQLEPSCFPNLFPLPLHQEDRNGGAIYSPPTSLKTVDDVFCACLKQGSLLCAVSSLPIIPGSSLSRESSMLLLDYCLNEYSRNSNIEADIFFDFSTEERSMMRDIFRFGAKLEDSGRGGMAEAYPAETDMEDEEASADCSSDSSILSSDDETDYAQGRKGYSLACGMLNLSWFTSKPSPSQQNLGDEKRADRRRRREERKKLLCTQTNDNDNEPSPMMGSPSKKQDDKGLSNAEECNANIGNVAGSVASLLVGIALPSNAKPEGCYSWKRSSALAYLLLGNDEALLLPRLSSADGTSLAKSALVLDVNGRLQQQTQGSQVGDRITELLTRCMISCSTEVGTVAAGKLLDLVLVILERTRHSSDLDTTLPGLLIIGITAGHVCGRVNEILDTQDKSIPFSRCFWAAKEKFESLHSF